MDFAALRGEDGIPQIDQADAGHCAKNGFECIPIEPRVSTNLRVKFAR
jgi:hypothetical protein